MDPFELNRVFEHLPGNFLLLRAEPGFPVVALSRQLRAITSDPDGAIGRPVFELFPEGPDTTGSIATLTASFERVIATRRPEAHEQRFDLRDPATGLFGKRFWSATNTPILDADGNVEFILHRSEDAAVAQRERERIASESEQQRRIYEAALSNTPDFVYIFGTDHRAIYANEALRKVWGVDDVRGKVWMDLGYEQWHADMHDRELAQVISTKAPIRGEIPFTGTNGRRIYDYIFAPVLDTEGNVVAVAGTTRDVTDRQAAERIIREHADRLAEADRAKDEFLATLSHELRNPLAPLRNGLELLRRMETEDAPSARIHAMMARQVEHLVHLVDDLMEVSRITRGNVSLQLAPVELAAVVETAVEAARPLIDANGHRLTVELPETPVVLRADRVRLAQVLANLLNNAAKYSEPNGDILLKSAVDDGAVSISVRDTGMGMVPEEIPHLFEMFTRGNRITSSHQGGLGIGLSLARRLSILHGGSLDATSDGPGRGSEFTVRLPLVQGAEEAAVKAEPRDQQLSHRILLADDNVDVGGSLAEALRLFGAEVHFADGGQAAIDAFDAFEPTVAILDIGMPRVTGYDVARALRSRGARVPLIALTGWGQAADRERAFTAGFDHHLVKPVAIDSLVDLLATLQQDSATAA